MKSEAGIHIQGTVVRGKGEARTLGYPTANLEYQSEQTIESGVWVCRCAIDGQPFQGLAVVGMWTLVHGLPSIEVHLLDTSLDLYDRVLEVFFMTRLRPLVSVASVEALIVLIQKDIENARTFLRSSNL